MKINELRILIQEIIAEETSNELPKTFIKDKLNNILFGEENGVEGYLSPEWRLKREINPIERKARIELVIKQIDAYSELLKRVSAEEDTFVQATTNEGIFGPSKEDTANFEAELNDFIKTNNIKEKIAAKKLPDSYLEQMKAHVTKIAKTSKFKGGKLGFSNLARPIITYDTQMKTQGKG